MSTELLGDIKFTFVIWLISIISSASIFDVDDDMNQKPASLALFLTESSCCDFLHYAIAAWIWLSISELVILLLLYWQLETGTPPKCLTLYINNLARLLREIFRLLQLSCKHKISGSRNLSALQLSDSDHVQIMHRFWADIEDLTMGLLWVSRNVSVFSLKKNLFQLLSRKSLQNAGA
jgi:hypothetical protein